MANKARSPAKHGNHGPESAHDAIAVVGNAGTRRFVTHAAATCRKTSN